MDPITSLVTWMKSFYCRRCQKTVDLINKGSVAICPKCGKKYTVR